jgi:hypothetical protein
LLQLVVILILFSTMRIVVGDPKWFYVILNTGPLISMSLVTIFSVLMITLLRTSEHGVTQRRLELLGRYEKVLSEYSSKVGGDEEEGATDYSERQFREQATKVLRNLCSLDYPFWYQSACLWFAEQHQDRGEIVLPAVSVNFDEADEFEHGLEDIDGSSPFGELLLLHSTKHHSDGDGSGLLRFRRDTDAPAAFITLRRNGRRVGVLSLFGAENGPPLMQQEEAFLRALGSIIANTMEQWEGRYKQVPLKEMDRLFSCQSLDEVFPQAVKILKKYLEAAGCMVIFRPDPAKDEMELAAKDGFRSVQRQYRRVRPNRRDHPL